MKGGEGGERGGERKGEVRKESEEWERETGLGWCEKGEKGRGEDREGVKG